MAITVRELKRFLSACGPDTLVAIDEGGLTLEVKPPARRKPTASIEIGGWPEDEDDGRQWTD